MNDGCLDFLEGKTIDIQTFTDGAIDIHHIFPQKWCDEKAIPKSRYDSIINKTPLSASTNRIIGGSAPSSYLGSLERRASIDVARMDELVRSHAIDPLLLEQTILTPSSQGVQPNLWTGSRSQRAGRWLVISKNSPVVRLISSTMRRFEQRD